jgi:hypothetical protein
MKKIVRLVAALSAGVLSADVGCISSAQLQDFVFREFATIAADSVSAFVGGFLANDPELGCLYPTFFPNRGCPAD